MGDEVAKQGSQLREKLQALSISEEDSYEYEELMDQGKVLLIVTDSRARDVL
ncbi:General stress protein 17M [Staphylococcus aureus]|nr:General stress protein 17M [Staphylococcus aureus]